MQKIQSFIKDKEAELRQLTELYRELPNVEVHYGPLGIVYCDESINKKADTLEEFVPKMRYGFSFTNKMGVKIFSKPYAVQTRYCIDYETDWLSDSLSINSKLLVELMIKINSKYLSRLDHYNSRFPHLVEWVVRYDPNHDSLGFISPFTIDEIKKKIKLENSSGK